MGFLIYKFELYKLKKYIYNGIQLDNGHTWLMHDLMSHEDMRACMHGWTDAKMSYHNLIKRVCNDFNNNKKFHVLI